MLGRDSRGFIRLGFNLVPAVKTGLDTLPLEKWDLHVSPSKTEPGADLTGEVILGQRRNVEKKPI